MLLCDDYLHRWEIRSAYREKDSCRPSSEATKVPTLRQALPQDALNQRPISYRLLLR